MASSKPQAPQRRRLLRAALPAVASLALLGSLAGCVTERVVVRQPAPPPHVVVRNMPLPVHEDRGPAPAAYGWNWVPGHWKWEGNDWFWVHGRWVQQPVQAMPPVIVEQITVAPPAPHAFWVPGHWVWRFEDGGGWAWVKGGWRS